MKIYILGFILAASTSLAWSISYSDLIAIQRVICYETSGVEPATKRVIDVVVNRTKVPAFPNTISAVVSQPGQFTIPKTLGTRCGKFHSQAKKYHEQIKNGTYKTEHNYLFFARKGRIKNPKMCDEIGHCFK